MRAGQQQKQIEALTATVQKVSDQVALSKPAPQLVANPQIASSRARNEASQVRDYFARMRKSDLLANTRDNRRNCRLIHMLGAAAVLF